MIRGDFLPKLRADDHLRFFDLKDTEACSTQAIEQNFDFVVEVVATLAAEPVWMAHAGWKAGKFCLIQRNVFDVVPVQFFSFSQKCWTKPGGVQKAC